jgi:hypothetical protein
MSVLFIWSALTGQRTPKLFDLIEPRLRFDDVRFQSV